jgi:hypothetical protein
MKKEEKTVSKALNQAKFQLFSRATASKLRLSLKTLGEVCNFAQNAFETAFSLH